NYKVVKIGGSLTGIKETKSVLPVSIYPNPSNGKFNLQLRNITVPVVEVTVSDVLGRVVLLQEIQVTGQQISRELTLQSAKGIYLLQLKAGEQTTTHKIVIE